MFNLGVKNGLGPRPYYFDLNINLTLTMIENIRITQHSALNSLQTLRNIADSFRGFTPLHV